MGGGGSVRVGVCASRGGGRGCGMRRSGVSGSCSARNRGVSGLVRARQTQRKGEGEGERNVRAHAGAVQEEEAAGGAVEVPSPPEEFDAKKFRRQLSSSDKYNRRAKNDEKVKELMETEGVGAVSAGASLRRSLCLSLCRGGEEEREKTKKTARAQRETHMSAYA